MALIARWTCGCLEIDLPQGLAAVVMCTHHQPKVIKLLEESPGFAPGRTYGEALDSKTVIKNKKIDITK